MDQRSSPASFADSLARNTPDLLPVIEIEHDEKRVGRVIAKESDATAMYGGRACVAPANPIFADIDDAEVAAPQKPAGEVVTIKTFGTEEGHEDVSPSPNSDTSTRALQAALFKLTSDELFAIGVTQIHHPGQIDWAVAWSSDSDEVSQAIGRALKRVGVGWFASCRYGRAGWYVERGQFFTARRALLDAPDVQRLGVQIVEPRFSLR